MPRGTAALTGRLLYTVGLVAEMLGEDEDWLGEISMGVPPQEGRLKVLEPNGLSVTAFTEFGIENLQYIIQAHDECPVFDSPWPSNRR